MDLYEFINTAFTPTKKEEPVLDIVQESIPPKEPEIPSTPSENEILKNRIKDLETLVEVLQSERSEITSRLKNTEYDKASLEGLIQELKEKQSYLIEQIKAVKEEKDIGLVNNISALQKEIQSLLQEKMEVLNSNKQLESTVDTLNKDKQELENTIKSLLSEKEQLLKNFESNMSEKEKYIIEVLNSNKQLESTVDTLNKDKQELENTIKSLLSEKEQLLKNFESNMSEKDRYIDEIKKSISLLQVELKEKQLIIERLTENNIEHKSHIDDLKREYAKYKQNTIFVIIALIVVTIITIIIIMNNKIHQKSSTLMQPPIQKPQQSNEVKKEIATGESSTPPSNTTNPTGEAPTDKQKISPNNSSKANSDKKAVINVSPAKQDRIQSKDIKAINKEPFTLKMHGFNVSLKPMKVEEMSKLNLPPNTISKINGAQPYLIKLKTKAHLIDYDFKKSPSISFIYQGDDKSKPVNVVSVTYKRYKKDSTVKITCIVTTDRENKPVGIVLGPMNKNKLKIIIV